jgi:hypothetical protein
MGFINDHASPKPKFLKTLGLATYGVFQEHNPLSWLEVAL